MEANTPQQNSKSTQPEDLKLPSVNQQLTYPLDYVSQEIIRQFVATIVPQSFPIGSVFIAVVDTDPSILLGYGTWSAFATGKTLIGVDISETRFDSVEESGGEITHTLSDNELPVHDYNVNGPAGFGPFAWGTVAGNTGNTLTGGGASFDILPPYITVYMWKRLT